MDEASVRLALEVFLAVVITGLGGQEIIKRWQEYSLKRNEKKFDHELNQESRGIEWIIKQAEDSQKQVESLQTYYREAMERVQTEKFAVIHADLLKVLDALTPCKDTLEELYTNRKNTTNLITEVKETNQKQNNALKFLLERMRFDRNKSDTSGELASLMDSLSEVEDRKERVKTGTWEIHPRPANDNAE